MTLNRAGVRELLRSEEMQTMLRGKADAAVQACGDGYRAGSFVETTRAVARVSAVSARAKRENLKDNTILKALR